MRKYLLLSVLVAAAACNRADKQLIGDWEFDEATYELIPRYRELEPEERQHWIETAQLDVSITKDTIGWKQKLPGWGTREASGAYRVVRTEGRRVDVAWNPGETAETIVFTVEDDRLRFALKGRSIILKRVQPSGP